MIPTETARTVSLLRRHRASESTGTLGPTATTTWELGRTHLGRPIEAVVRSEAENELRVLVIGGQHGDEPSARRAVEHWIANDPAARESGARIEGLGRAAVPDANPDGSSVGRRRNAEGIDLNRDHLLLSTSETRAIHELVRRFRPHLIVDVHNYPARRRHLLARGWTIGPDVQLAAPTHPAIRTGLGPSDTEDLFRSVESSLGARGYSFSPYTLFRRSGKARPSTLRVRDARNSLALRYGIPTFLLEGRDPGRTGTSEDGPRTTAALVEALRAIEVWALGHRALLERGPPIPRTGETVPLDARWTDEGARRSVTFRDARSGRPVHVEWPHYAGTLHLGAAVSLPRAYAVRNDVSSVRELLDRHGIMGELVEGPRSAMVERATRTRNAPVVAVDGNCTESAHVLDLEGYTVYSVHQRGGRALSIWLEGGPRFGLPFLRPHPVLPGASERPPVVRIRLWDYASPRLGTSWVPARPVGGEPLSAAEAPTAPSGMQFPAAGAPPVPGAVADTPERDFATAEEIS